MSEPDSRVDRPTSPGSGKSQADWKTSVLIHGALLTAAVIVVWSTIGRDPQSNATASAVSPPAALDPRGDASVSAEPFIAASALSGVTQTTITERPRPAAAPTPVTAEIPRAVATEPAADVSVSEPEAPAVLGMPEPGQQWPIRMTVPPQDDPFVAYGRVYGTPGATRIVYLIDASGSLIDTLPFVQVELQKALRSLRPDQSYAVMFLQGDRVVEAPPVGMKPASTRAVTHTMQWIDPAAGKVIPSGKPDAHAAIRRALAYQPDAVVLLSDGLTGRGQAGLNQRAKIVSLIDAANTAGTVFHTVQLSQPDPLATPTRRGTLELIAHLTGGAYRFVDENDLDTGTTR